MMLDFLFAISLIYTKLLRFTPFWHKHALIKLNSSWNQSFFGMCAIKHSILDI